MAPPIRIEIQDVEDFIAAFDEFIGALAEHGAASRAAQGGAILAGGMPKGAAEDMARAQNRFDASRDALVAARDRLGPLRISPKPKDGISERLWTPGRP